MESLGKFPRSKPHRDFPRDSIHHDTLKAFPPIFILSSSRTCKEGFCSANGLPREYHGKAMLQNTFVTTKYSTLGCSIPNT